jgi:hypothetical protein
MKQFTEFKGIVKDNFRDLMVQYWMDDEGYSTKHQALLTYGGHKFEFLCNDLVGEVRTFTPDIGYKDKSIDGTLCFEKEDNNFVIPVNLINIQN